MSLTATDSWADERAGDLPTYLATDRPTDRNRHRSLASLPRSLGRPAAGEAEEVGGGNLERDFTLEERAKQKQITLLDNEWQIGHVSSCY